MASSSALCAAFVAVLLGASLRGVDAQSQLRFFHGGADIPSVDILVDGETTVSGLEYGEGSAILEVPPGTYNVGVASEGSTVVMLDVGDVDVADGKIYNAMVTRGIDGAPVALIAPMNVHTPKNDSSRVTVYHLYAQAPAVKVFVLPRGERLKDAEDTSTIAFGSVMRFGNVPAGVYSIFSTLDDGAAAKGSVAFKAGGTTIPAGLDIFIPVIMSPVALPSPIRLIFGTGAGMPPSEVVTDTRETVDAPGPGGGVETPGVPTGSPMGEPTDTPGVDPTQTAAADPSTTPMDVPVQSSSTDSPVESSAGGTQSAEPAETPASSEAPSVTDSGSTGGSSTESPGPPAATDAPAATENPDEVCIGVESTIHGKPVLEYAASARMQTHPLNSGDSVSKVLCTKLGEDRLCATATHIVTFDNQPVYMRELCNGPVKCVEEHQKVFNVKTESGIVADYSAHNIQLTHSAARLSLANYVSASRMMALEKTAQRYATPAWRILTQ